MCNPSHSQLLWADCAPANKALPPSHLCLSCFSQSTPAEVAEGQELTEPVLLLCSYTAQAETKLPWHSQQPGEILTRLLIIASAPFSELPCNQCNPHRAAATEIRERAGEHETQSLFPPNTSHCEPHTPCHGIHKALGPAWCPACIVPGTIS